LQFERHFDLDGCAIAVRGRGQDLACVIDLLLGPYACPLHDTDAAIDILIERRAATPARPQGRGKPKFSFAPLEAWENADGGWRLVDDVAELDVHPHPQHARIEGWLADDAAMPLVSRFAGLSLWVALMECLRARGRYPLHGAALVTPEGETILFSGTKGAGKSTATLSLLERGFDVLTDDTLFLERHAGGIDLLGYRKRFHVRPDLIARRPDLAPFARWPAAFEPQDKLWLVLEERFPGRTRTRVPAPSRIYFPSIVERPRSRVVPLAPRETLLRLLADSSLVFVRPEVAPAHLACLRALVDGAAGALLECGRDLFDDPSLYLPLLASKGEPWPSSASASS
jgi:hypothetical protein